MSVLWIVALAGIAGGLSVAVQAPLASMLGQRLGILESIFIINVGGALTVGVPLLALGGGRLGGWPGVPWYALACGALGVVTVGAMVYMVPRIGVAGAVVLIVAGQFTMAMLLDHFGAFGITVQAVSLQRLAGVVLVFTGVWLALRASSA